MSTFFRALERAEQERALRRTTMPAPAPSEEAIPGAASVVPAREELAPQPPVTLPDPTREPSPTAPTPRPRKPAAVAPRPRREADRDPEGRDRQLEEHLVSLLAPSSFEADQYRALRHTIEQFRRSAELSVIAVSSPDASDGKTTTAINLAGTLAQAPDARVLLVDADLRGPSLAANLGLGGSGEAGLVDVILDSSLSLESVTQERPDLNLSVVTAGCSPASPYEVLKSPRVGTILAEARERYDYIILDTPPLVSVPDSRVIGKWVDGFLIVVAAHRTPRPLLQEALNLMEPAKIVGLVFNGDDRHVSRGFYATKQRRGFRGMTNGKQTAVDG